MGPAGFFTITRPANSVVAGLAAIVAYLIATGALVPGVILLMAVVALITAAGNVINDYYDAAIDAINRPERPIPSGTVSRNAALVYAGVLFFLGILISGFTSPLCLAIAIVQRNPPCRLRGPAQEYAVFRECSGLVPRGKHLPLWRCIGRREPAAGHAAARGYYVPCHACPGTLKGCRGHRRGPCRGCRYPAHPDRVRKTALLAFVFAVAAVAASVIPSFWWGAYYLGAIALVDIVIALAAFRALGCTDPGCVKSTGSTSLLKIGMFASLVVFTLSAVLL